MNTATQTVQILVFNVLVKLGPLFLALCACGQTPDTFHSIFNGSSAVTNEQLQEIGQLVQSYDASFDMSRVVLHVSTGFKCPSSDSCTRRETDGYIHVYSDFDPQYSNENNTELLTHELGHALYYQTMNDGDEGHLHHEFFARPCGEYAAFAGEIGTATYVARDYSSAY